jgi:ParB-like chromosome segregation protein Spo0J
MQKIEYIDVSELKPHPNNPRVIKDAAFATLCESIRKNKDYFETRPILCNKKKIVFAGNMRLAAAKKIGMKKVPVAIMDIPVDRQKEIMIRDNRAQGEWDWDKLANEFDQNKLVEWGFSEDDFYIDQNQPDEEESDGDAPGTRTCPSCGHQW